jgi:hypothetical protein
MRIDVAYPAMSGGSEPVGERERIARAIALGLLLGVFLALRGRAGR